MINERVCEGCGDCGQQSNCLSVQPVDTDFGRKTTIDQSSCNKDFSCLAGDCPSFVDGPPRRGPAAAPPHGARRSAPRTCPSPAARFDVDAAPHTTRITGVGGTGIVTVSQILAAAAGFAGPGGPHAGPDRPGPEGRRGRLRRQDQRVAAARGEQGGRGRMRPVPRL